MGRGLRGQWLSKVRWRGAEAEKDSTFRAGEWRRQSPAIEKSGAVFRGQHVTQFDWSQGRFSVGRGRSLVDRGIIPTFRRTPLCPGDDKDTALVLLKE